MIRGPNLWTTAPSFALGTPQMCATSTIQFTPEQARSVSGVSRESLRHWRGAVPYLENKSGKAARFDLGDLLGLAILQELKTQIGVSIVAIAPAAQCLFEHLSKARFAELLAATAMLSRDKAGLLSKDDLRRVPFGQAAAYVPCGPLLNRICIAVLPGYAPNAQPSLPFPPQAVLRARL